MGNIRYTSDETVSASMMTLAQETSDVEGTRENNNRKRQRVQNAQDTQGTKCTQLLVQYGRSADADNAKKGLLFALNRRLSTMVMFFWQTNYAVILLQTPTRTDP